MARRSFNIYEAKAKLSSLVEAAASGEEIILARNGKPLAKLIAYADDASAWHGRGFGSCPDLVVPDDFDDALPRDVIDSFSA
ncbi:MAG: type II toxin-antitoxin system prevent-host-death family antitoxin [Candidatus Eremiobacteraeota bacterium]|nr:type II toxin-antitoxin system prevent-host-death family antitoxin [Candidatus Eremiobacteraeota bacterium]